MRIFYSWQSDTPRKIGQTLIRDALQMAIADLAADLDLNEADRPELDHDTKGVLGSPGIFEPILEKIDDCDVFVADVTIVGNTSSGKALINSNVAVELGYALKSKGYEALLLIMNKGYGDAEKLPFDLRHRRWPTQYLLSGDANKVDREKAQAELAAVLKPILREYLQRPAPVADVEIFAEAKTTASPAHYFESSDTLVPQDLDRGWK